MLLVVGCGNGSSGEHSGSVVGELFPDIALPSVEGGDATSISAYRGRVVILNLWATWCAPCRRELPSLQKLDGILDDHRFVVIGLSVDDDPLLVREYLLDKGVDYANFRDPGAQAVSEQLKITTYPDTFIIGRDGKLLGQVIGERIWHTAEVVGELDRAYAGEIVTLDQ